MFIMGRRHHREERGHYFKIRRGFQCGTHWVFKSKCGWRRIWKVLIDRISTQIIKDYIPYMMMLRRFFFSISLVSKERPSGPARTVNETDDAIDHPTSATPPWLSWIAGTWRVSTTYWMKSINVFLVFWIYISLPVAISSSSSSVKGVDPGYWRRWSAMVRKLWTAAMSWRCSKESTKLTWGEFSSQRR